ncbi:MAG: DUF4349 domain-containing protein [Armatimonadota bacterium]|nr:DUF4349 domain-containing protein [bacterium]
MNCQRVRDNIKAYIDGELGTVERWRVEWHVVQCSECRREMTAMMNLTQKVRTAQSVSAPEGLRDKIMDNIQLDPAPVHRLRWPYVTSPVAAAAVLIVTVVAAAVLMPIFSNSKEAARPESQGMDSPMQSAPGSVPGPMAKRMASKSLQQPLSSNARGPASLAPSPNLMIIKTANLMLEVKDFQTISDQAIAVAKSAGGYVTDSSADTDDATPTSGAFAIRVPADSFESTMQRLSRLGKVKSKSISGQDVTGQVVDLESRLRNKRAEERQYLEIMNKAHRVPDIVTVSNELYRVRGEIEETQGQIKYLKSAAAMSTINLTLIEKSKSKPVHSSIGNAFTGAIASLGSTLSSLVAALIWLFVYSPFWAVPLVVIYYLRKRAPVNQ